MQNTRTLLHSHTFQEFQKPIRQSIPQIGGDKLSIPFALLTQYVLTDSRLSIPLETIDLCEYRQSLKKVNL